VSVLGNQNSLRFQQGRKKETDGALQVCHLATS
jgi:hypothetical protein